MRVGQSDNGLRQLVVETVSSTTRLEPLSTPGKPIGLVDSSRHENTNQEASNRTMFDDIHSKCGIYVIALKWTF